MKKPIFFITSALRLLAFKIEIFGILLSKERKYSTKLPFTKRFRAWRKGFLSDSYLQYFGRKEQDLEFYISDFERWNRTARLNEKYGIVLADKVMFNYYFSPFRKLLPENYFLIKKGNLIDPQVEGVSQSEHITKLQHLLTSGQKLILKPTLGYGGLSIFKVEMTPDGTFLLNNETLTVSELLHRIKSLDNYVVTEFIDQDGYANKIFPASTNTVRLITIYDKDSNEAWLGGAAHRFGAKSTGVVDNWTSGGLSAAIDIQTGVLGQAAINPRGKLLLWRDDHPDTLAPIKGVQIPNWDAICRKMLEVARYCHFCPYIGWDLLICSNGFYIIEGNDSPDIHILQIHEPLLKPARNRAFFQKNGLYVN